MAGTSFRSWQRHSVGRLLVTVTLEPLTSQRNLQEHRRLSQLADRLVQRLSEWRIDATWGVSDPMHAAETAAILEANRASNMRHELAVLGDDNWMGSSAGRPRFAKELARRFQPARAQGIPVTTLLAQQSCPTEHVDLLSKHGVTAIASIDAPADGWHRTVLPKSVRWGVWDLRLTGRWPQEGVWLAGRRLARRIRRTTDEGAVFHLLVDAPAVCQQGEQAERTLSWILDRLVQRRNRGFLEVETMAAAAARLSDVPVARPQRSILRQAG